MNEILNSIVKNKPVLLRDVMNSKSSNHFRHSVDAYDAKKLSFYYAVESRIFNGIWNDDLEKYVRGPIWFTNLMVFDFDFDEGHFPNIADYEIKLKSSLNMLESILGKPKYKIYNKTEFSDWEKDVYFTKDGIIKLPKKYGCQVVYELKESLQSQYKERVKLYNLLRLKITEICDGDLNFKGHMFKNTLNHRLFNIQKNNDHSLVDIFLVAKSFNFKDVQEIEELKAFEVLSNGINEKNILPEYLKNYSNMLNNFYLDLNSWKSNSSKVNFKNKMFYANNCKKSESRNETLFDYFKSLPMQALGNTQYQEIINIYSTIFGNCTIKEIITEEEFYMTKQSVFEYRKENHIGALELTGVCR